MRIFVAGIGLFGVLIGLVGLFMGRESFDRRIDWWLSGQNGVLRLSAVFASAFGGFLIYVAT